MKIITAPTAEPITLAQVKSQLGITDTDSDTELTRRISEAREWAEDYARISIMPRTLELRQDTFTCEIALPLPPVISVGSVKYIAQDGTLTTVDSADYDFDDYPTIPVIRPAYGIAWPSPRTEPGAVRVRYDAGYAVTDIGDAVTLTDLTLAAPGVFSSTDHGFADGDLIRLDIDGTTELDGGLYRVYAADDNSFQLANLEGTAGISTIGMGEFDSGTATRVSVAVPEILTEAMIVLIGHWTNYQSRIQAGNLITRVPAAVEQMLQSKKVYG